MLGSLAKDFGAPESSWLYLALLFSGLAHIGLLLGFGGQGASNGFERALPRIEARLVVAKTSDRQVDASPISLSYQDAVADRSLGMASPDTDVVRAHELRKALRLSSELDRELVAIAVPDLEPDYGFANDAGGRIILNLLVAGDGSVRWVYVESSEADPSVTEYIARMFQFGRFESPTFLGVPVMAFTKVEVMVPRASD